MSAHRHLSLLSRTSAASALALASLCGALLAPGCCSAAQAASVSVSTRALHIAALKEGAPYVYGAAGPFRFDCSGLTYYAFRHAGRQLPRTAMAQYTHSRHIAASQRRLGDLVFFHWGRYVYHVGIYAGHNRIWHAPRRGGSVRLEHIWSRHAWYGRVS